MRMMLGGFGDSRTASFVFIEGKSTVHAYSTHWNKIATCDFGSVTVLSCETALFFQTVGLFHGMQQTNR